MKTKAKCIIVLVMIMSSVFSQCKTIFLDPIPPENYITGAMIVGTYYIVNYADYKYYKQYGNAHIRTKQRDMVALTCMGTTIITHFTIQLIKKRIRRR